MMAWCYSPPVSEGERTFERFRHVLAGKYPEVDAMRKIPRFLTLIQLIALPTFLIAFSSAFGDPADCYIRMYSQDGGATAYVNGPSWHCSSPTCDDGGQNCESHTQAYQGKYLLYCQCELPINPSNLCVLGWWGGNEDGIGYGTPICRNLSCPGECSDVTWGNGQWVGVPPTWTESASPCTCDAP